MNPIARLFEDLPSGGALPAKLARLYDGPLAIPPGSLYANFVASIDGVVTLKQSDESGATISGKSEADRLVMALLRARADAVLIGAETFRKAPGALWHAEAAYPELASSFVEMRAGKKPPPLVIVSASGEIDPHQPALNDAVIVTTKDGVDRLRERVPSGTRFIQSGLDMPSILRELRALGLATILTEGGPSLVAQLMREHLVDELFLTSAPTLFGRFDGDGRRSLVHGLDLAGERLRLLSVRRHGSHLFLRYALPR